MTADLLRTAASKMREQAQAATPGPWEAYQNIHAEFAAVEAGRGGFGVVALPATQRPDYGRANIEHMASWHPLVALAVADLLDVTAKDVGTSSLAFKAAEVVAHAYLGTDLDPDAARAKAEHVEEQNREYWDGAES